VRETRDKVPSISKLPIRDNAMTRFVKFSHAETTLTSTCIHWGST